MESLLCRRKVLVLLDDVDTLDQLQALAGKHNWFGSGSRIIITTRDEHLLRTHKVDHVYPVRLLSNDNAIRLFKRHAYNEKDPVDDYETLSLQLVSYASGLPLSLKVLGSFLYDKNKKEWISALEKLKDIPNKEVMDILKISYDGLKPDEKELFLDIACFLRRYNISYAKEVPEACGFHYEIGIKVLIQKALITIVNVEDSDVFDMHDTIQEMGHFIVRRKHPKNPENHSRVWKHEEIREMCFMDTIVENQTIQAIQDNDIYYQDYPLPICNLISNTKKLRLLHMYTEGGTYEVEGEVATDEVEGSISLSNELRYIHLENYCIRSPFVMNSSSPMKLVILKLCATNQEELWEGYQHLPHLKVLELRCMKKLLKTPDFNGLPLLQRLKLDYCSNLEKIHPSLDNHTSLECLEVSYCGRLWLPTFSHMKNMKTLYIGSCSLKDVGMPCGIGELSNLQVLSLSDNDFSRLNFSLSQLTHLTILNLSFCSKLIELPKLPSSLLILNTSGCESLTLVEDFYENCKELCEVSLESRGQCSTGRLLQSMLKGKAIENGCMHLSVKGDLEIAKEFTPPLVRGESSYDLEVPENWCNNFSGFLICVVFPRLWQSKNQASGLDLKDGAVWVESIGDRSTCMWYISFASLRHASWWDQTYNVISFDMLDNTSPFPSGYTVKLAGKKSRECLTESSTNSPSLYTPKIKIQHDSTTELVVNLEPYSSGFPQSTLRLSAITTV